MRRLLVLLLALVPTAVSAWPPDGARLTGARREQQRPALASDGAGGAFVAWIDFRDAGMPLDYDNDLYLQRVTATGQIATGWPADAVAIATGPGGQGAWAMIPDGTGGVLIVYGTTQADAGDLYLQRITGAGEVAPGWPTAGVPLSVAPDQQGSTELVGDGEGGAFASWQSGNSAYYTHVEGLGQVAPGWPTNGRLFEPGPAVVGRPLMLQSTRGGFLSCWAEADDPDQTSVRILSQHFTADGAPDPAWPAGGAIVCVDLPEPRGPVATLQSNQAGGFFTVWVDYRASAPGTYDESDIYAQHVQADGTLAPGWPEDGLVVSALPGVTQWDPVLSEDGRGGVYIAWEDYRAGYAQIFGVHLAPDGQRHSGWPAGGRLLCNALAFQLDPKIVWDGFDGAYLTWMNLESVGYRSYAQHLTPSGAPAPGWPPNGLLVATTPGDQYEPAIVRDGGPGAIVAWSDGRTLAPAFADIYAQRFVNDGVVATQVSLAGVEASADEVRIRWRVSGETRASVERRGGDADRGWSVIAQLEADGAGYLSLVDRDVVPGTRYEYRLAFPSGVRGGETSVFVPALALALEGARPNPAVGALWLAFTLPDASPARLELYDLAGRQVAARDVGSRGPGRHVVRLDDGALAQGLYWAVLRHGGRSLKSRVVVAD